MQVWQSPKLLHSSVGPSVLLTTTNSYAGVGVGSALFSSVVLLLKWQVPYPPHELHFHIIKSRALSDSIPLLKESGASRSGPKVLSPAA